MLIAWFPVLVMILGALIYGFFADKPAELGRLMFFVGLLVVVYMEASHTVHL